MSGDRKRFISREWPRDPHEHFAWKRKQLSRYCCCARLFLPTTMIGDCKRFISHEWPRDPHGQVLPEPPPKGVRTPNNIPWGHTMDDFYWYVNRFYSMDFTQ